MPAPIQEDPLDSDEEECDDEIYYCDGPYYYWDGDEGAWVLEDEAEAAPEVNNFTLPEEPAEVIVEEPA